MNKNTHTMLLGIDIGQSACKVSALSTDGRLLSSRSAGYPTSRPRPGWVEQDPSHWLDAVQIACRELIALHPDATVVGIGVTSATHNAVLLNSRGLPIRPAILLADTRAAEEAAELDGRLGDYLLATTRNRVTAGWTFPQLCWVAKHEPEAWATLERVVFAKDYARQALTGDDATDWIDAEGSLLLNVARRTWDDDLCGEVPLATGALPSLVAPSAVVGTTSSAALRFGLPEGIPVVAGCSDTAAEALAAGANDPGVGVVKLATAGNVNVVTASPRPSPNYFTYTHPLDGLAYHSFGTNSAASARDWLQQLLGMTGALDYPALDAELTTTPPGAEGLLFHPYLNGERAPVFDPALRASFLGLSFRHTRAHLVRAVLEGVALSLADCASVGARSGIKAREWRLIGGGARSEAWAQIVADILARPVCRPVLTDASCGAALVAGVGAGVFSDLREAAAVTGDVKDRFAPVDARSQRYAELLELYRDARSALASAARGLQTIVFPD